MPSPQREHDRPQEPLLGWLLFAVLLLACATPLALNLTDPDLWGHVLYGQEWIADGVLPRTATHTFTAEGYRWINHENLAELLLASGFGLLGTQGMLLAKCLFGMTILGLMAHAAARQGVAWPLVWGLLILVAKNLEAFFPFRPQLLSFFFCALMLTVLDRAFSVSNNGPRTLRWRWLLLLPLIVILWINSHGGVIAGLAILTTFLLGRMVEQFWYEGRNAWLTVFGLVGVVAASLGATLVNPYGVGLLAWYAESLGTARPEITEWASPLPGNPVFLPFVALVVLASLLLVLTRERRDPVRWLLLALVGWQAAEHLRHIAFFALLCGFWLPIHLRSVVLRIRESIPQQPPMSLAPWLRATLIGSLSVCLALQTIDLGKRLRSLPVYRSNYPVDALRWMSDQEVQGKLVVSFNWAQYAIFALATDVRVAFDGRFRTCYPQEMVDQHFDFLMGDLGPRSRSADAGPIDGKRVLQQGEPDYVLLDRRYPHARGVMQSIAAADDPEWSLMYQDAISQLWGRSQTVDDLASPQYVPESERLISNHFSETSVEWPALAPSRTFPQPSRSLSQSTSTLPLSLDSSFPQLGSP